MREDWIEIELGKVCNFKGGGTPSKKVPEYWNGTIPWASIKDLKGDYLKSTGDFITERGLNESSSNLALENEIIIGTRINPGRPILTRITTAINQDLKIAKPKTKFDIKFLFYVFKNVEPKILKVSSGTTVLGINLNSLNDIKISFPSLPEQRAIVSKIEQLFSELDNGIANLKSAREKLEIYRQAVLKKAFEGELTKEWRKTQIDLPTGNRLLDEIKLEKLRNYQNQFENWKKEAAEWEKNRNVYKKPKKPIKINKELELNPHESQKLKTLPKNWAYINIDFASWKLGDGLHGTPVYSNGEYYFINGNNLQNGKITIKKNTKRISKTEAIKHFRELTDRTILISINGTLGNIAFYNNEKVTLGKSACYFNLISTINKEYVRWIIESNEFKKYLDKTATGSTIKNVPLKAIRNFTFPICSKEEQNEIVQEIESRLSVCDKLVESINESLEKSETLRQSILKKAFTGELLTEKELEACKQEVDWEPAEKLLERIQNK